ncbi:MAG: hypothetical protein LLF76_03655 [Planctomycetaceae bacterium]|nr:hypothetical protein [Planctomycetaceae bacterium]
MLTKEEKTIRILKSTAALILLFSIISVSCIISSFDLQMIGLFVFPYGLCLLFLFLFKKRMRLKGAWVFLITAAGLGWGVFAVLDEYVFNPSAWRVLTPVIPIFQLVFLGLALISRP